MSHLPQWVLGEVFYPKGSKSEEIFLAKNTPIKNQVIFR